MEQLAKSLSLLSLSPGCGVCSWDKGKPAAELANDGEALAPSTRTTQRSASCFPPGRLWGTEPVQGALQLQSREEGTEQDLGSPLISSFLNTTFRHQHKYFLSQSTMSSANEPVTLANKDCSEGDTKPHQPRVQLGAFSSPPYVANCTTPATSQGPLDSA